MTSLKPAALPTFLIAVLGGVAVFSPYAFVSSLIDAAAAATIFIPGSLLGALLLSLSRIDGRVVARRWRVLLSVALGMGSLSLLVLAGGLVGILQRPLWIVLLTIISLLGALPAWRLWRHTKSAESCTPSKNLYALDWFWLACAPFLILALLGAANAPGFIWQEEGNGYDVLEYHLQLPKEYLRQGRITYLPHNVYANFPGNVEMIYLLAMILHGPAEEAGTTANIIHLGFAVLGVAAAWAIGRDWSQRGGLVAGLSLATASWLEYLSGLAYVENAMLFYGLCAAPVFLTLRPWLKESRLGEAGQREGWTGSVACGLCSGLACGCKYTAAAMIALPLAVGNLFGPGSLRRRIGRSGVFLFATLLAFAPWLVKNLAFTGNPVFPLANQWLGATPAGWSDEQTRQWDRGHAPAENERTPGSKVRTFWRRVVADPEQRFGPAILLIGLLGLGMRRRDRVDRFLVVVMAVQLGVWVFGTHLYARFAIPLLIPLALLAGRSLLATSGRTRAALVLAGVLGGAAWNSGFALARHARESPGGAPASLFYTGQVPGFEYLGVMNQKLPGHARILLLGDARPFYVQHDVGYVVTFNHNPLFQLLREKAPAEEIIEWLRQDGFTHVLIHWSEMRRLERSYGFAPPMTSAELLESLGPMSEAGLERIASFSHPSSPTAAYVDLYRVPAPMTRADAAGISPK